MKPLQPILIQSRDNPLIKQLRRLAQESGAYRKQGRVWIEGEHLCSAARLRGWRPEVVVCAESVWHARGGAHASFTEGGQAPHPCLSPKGRGRSAAPDLPPLPPEEDRGEGWPSTDPGGYSKPNQPQTLAPQALTAIKTVVVPDVLWREFTALESPAGMGYVLGLPEAPALLPGAPTVVLDRVQDAGNVGSILRSSAAFGFTQIAALKGTALLWSPKVLRAGMGAHFALRLVEGLELAALDALAVPLLATSSHQGEWLHRARLPWPCGWLLGHEGQGVSPALQARAACHIRIAQPGGEESLNVAAAAAICLHASAALQAGA
ncbi:TrmH family RNA methyltransferase [Comamonas flocculans]|nr:RNA methyltransferase [Comamonas flocculans]